MRSQVEAGSGQSSITSLSQQAQSQHREAAEARARQHAVPLDASKLASLEPAQREAVEALTRGIVKKLLHEPTVRVKDAAGSARGDYYVDALGALFDLPASDE